VDGDSDLDAVLASNSGDPQEVWFNDGGTFPISATFGAGNSRSVEVWTAISRGELNGTEAFLSGAYQVEGEMSVLMQLDSLFGSN
jgi:putative sterol carrier protein